MVEPLLSPAPHLAHGNSQWTWRVLKLRSNVVGSSNPQNFVGKNQVLRGMCFVSVRIIYANIGGLMFWRLLLDIILRFDEMILRDIIAMTVLMI